MPTKLLDQASSAPDSSLEKTGALQGLIRNKILRTLGVTGTAVALYFLSGCVTREKNPVAGIEQQRKYEVSRVADLADLTLLKQTTPKGWTAYYLFPTIDVERLDLDQTENFLAYTGFGKNARPVAKLEFSPKESLEDMIFASLPDGQVLFGMKTKKRGSDKSKMRFYHAENFEGKGMIAYPLLAKYKYTTYGNPRHGKFARIIPGKDLASSRYIPGSKDEDGKKFIPTGEGVLLGSLDAIIPPKGAAPTPSAEKTPPGGLKPVSREKGKKTSELGPPPKDAKIKAKGLNF